MKYERLRQMSIWSLTGLWFSCLVFSMTAMADEVSVEITGSDRHQIKIAVPAFVPQSETSEVVNAELSPVLRNDLRISGFFDTLEEEYGQVAGLHNADVKAGSVQFSQWDELGARLLVKGLYELNGTTLVIECRVYDTLGGDFILGKRYESDTSHAREIMHRFADEIILKMTGERGMSSAKLLFTSDRNGGMELYQIDFDGNNMFQLTHDESLIVTPAVSPDGTRVAYTSYIDNNPDLYVLSLETLKPERIAMFAGLNFSADWAPDNQTLAVTLSKDGNPELYLLDSFSQDIVRLTENSWNDLSPAWSPDGQEIVYTADNIGAPQLYIMEHSGQNVRRLTFSGSYNVSPAWSPTGEEIAFSSSMDGQFNIYTIQPNGDYLRQLTQDAGNNEEPAWSYDGRFLAFQSTRDGVSSIYVMNEDGSNQRRLTDGKGTDVFPAWIR
ncbi:Tol-Pal system beta propeller repeat protein TolB [candidate division KSB3 bacterium]|uniref:Tol-Pal system beta propeller repeat protein TolB n=1 Tax=candidate division KSB3 bacterium TaxID=2044937 RepID=A0A2G6KG43_9BACT|nr:MAG: Tol-Pal system beta propeller repeat protein TolB [candidate division KSB3 bacterium]